MTKNGEYEDLAKPFTCEICGEVKEAQYDFYCHLKEHYEVANKDDREFQHKVAADEEHSSVNSISDNDFGSEKLISVEILPENVFTLNSIQETEILYYAANIEKKDDLTCKTCYNDDGQPENSETNTSPNLASKEKSNKISCEICGKIFGNSNSKKVHSRIHNDIRPYSCSLCDAKFRQLGDLTYHQQSKHSNNDFQCEFCGKEFARKYSLTLHRKIHTGELNHRCDLCPKAFRASVYLQNHRRIHTGEKPFICPKCPRKFRVKADVGRHLRVHSSRETRDT